MPHRRANYILSKTRSIRNLTVKGLEPELDQLMEAHQSDLVKLHAAKVAIRRRISVALDGELLQRRLVLVDVVRRQHARSEYQERTRVERCMKLEQGQIWKKGDQYLLITLWARLDIEYKQMASLETREGSHHAVSKKEFCRLIKGAELYHPH